jgi:hypothetical protein
LDTWIALSSKLVTIPKADIDVSAAVTTYLPLSINSRHDTLITAITGSLALRRVFKWEARPGWNMSFSAAYGFAARKNFHKYTVPVEQNQNSTNQGYTTPGASQSIPTVLIRNDDAVTAGGIASGYANTTANLANSLTLTFSPYDPITLRIGYSLTNGFKYATNPTADQYTSIYAKPGPGRYDSERGVIEVGYEITDYLELALGILTVQPPFGPDNHTVYFPWLNATSPSSNYTQFYLNVGGSI